MAFLLPKLQGPQNSRGSFEHSKRLFAIYLFKEASERRLPYSSIARVGQVKHLPQGASLEGPIPREPMPWYQHSGGREHLRSDETLKHWAPIPLYPSPHFLVSLPRAQRYLILPLLPGSHWWQSRSDNFFIRLHGPGGAYSVVLERGSWRNCFARARVMRRYTPLTCSVNQAAVLVQRLLGFW